MEFFGSAQALVTKLTSLKNPVKSALVAGVLSVCGALGSGTVCRVGHDAQGSESGNAHSEAAPATPPEPRVAHGVASELPPSGGRGALVVHVTGLDGRAAAGARVVLAGSGVWPPRTAETDEDGATVLEPVPQGVYEVRAEDDTGVAEPVLGIELGQDERRNIHLALQPGRAIVGRVLDGATGAPIVFAHVVVGEDALAAAPRVARSGADGTFVIEPLTERLHRVSVRAPGYVAEIGRETTPGEAELEFRLHRGATLTGVVVDARGYPVSGAQIEVLGIGVAGGAVDVSALGTALEAAHFDRMTGAPATLMPTGELGVMQGPLPPIPGSPIAADPGPGYVVEASSGMVSGPRGEFRVDGVPPGRLSVVAFHLGHARGQSRGISVGEGATVDGIEIVLGEGHRVAGRVVDEAGFPLAAATVELRTELEQTLLAMTDSSGEFAFEAIDGIVVVRGSAVGRDPEVLTSPASGASDLELCLRAAAIPISGRVIDDRGLPIAGARLRVTRLVPGAQPAALVSRQDGTFEVTAAPGTELQIVATAAEHGAVIEELVVPASDRGLTVVMRSAGGIEGTVLAVQGFTVSPFELTLWTERGPPERKYVEDLDGRFRITDIAPGRVRMRIEAEGYVCWEQDVIVPLPVGGEDVTAEVRVELQQALQAEGRVVDSRGWPVPGARVSAGAPRSLVLGNDRQVPTTDAQGRFVLGGLAPGELTLYAQHAQLGIASAEVDLRHDREDDILIELDGQFDEEAPLGGPARFGGVGVVLERGRVSEVLVGSEAENAGLRAGDRIAAVDGRSGAAAELVRALRGPVGTHVLVSIVREARPMRVLVRREILYR